jgi:hypothetical protein
MVHFNIKKQEKRDKIVNLTDMGRHNSMQARIVRDLQDDGTYRLRRVNWDGSLIPEVKSQDPNSIGATEGDEVVSTFIIANEDKGSSYQEPYQPTEIEPGFEDGLGSTGATVHSSVTYYPASGVTTSKRSMTPDESAAERDYSYYLGR